MVTENEQQVDITPEPQAEVQAEPDTQEPVAEATEQPVAEAAAPSTEQTVEAAPREEPKEESEKPNELDGIQSQMTQLQQTIQQQQEQLRYYDDAAQQQRAQQQATEYQKRLEEQGWMPDQAQTVAQNYATQIQESQRQQSEVQRQQQYREGQRNASVYYAEKYKLDWSDIKNLERFTSPQDMETEARRIKEFRDTKAELSKLKKEQVPPQKFDTNQPAASASGSEDELLDQYNSGVRNPQTEAAARRAAGLG
jgi:hypothetical protein